LRNWYYLLLFQKQFHGYLKTIHSVNQEKVEWNYILNKLYEKIDRQKPAPKVVRQKPLVGNAQYINSMDVISFDDIHQHKIYS